MHALMASCDTMRGIETEGGERKEEKEERRVTYHTSNQPVCDRGCRKARLKQDWRKEESMEEGREMEVIGGR